MDFPAVDRARVEWEQRKSNRFNVSSSPPTFEEMTGLSAPKKGVMQKLASSTAVKALMVAIPLIGVVAHMAPGPGDYSFDAQETAVSSVYTREHVMSSEKTGFLTEVRSVNVQKIEIAGGQVNYNVSQVDKSYLAGIQFKEKEIYNVTLNPASLEQRYVGANMEFFRAMHENYREIVAVMYHQKALDDHAAHHAEGEPIRFAEMRHEMDAFNAKFGDMGVALKLVRAQFNEGAVKAAYSFKQAADGKASPPAGETYHAPGLKLISYKETWVR